MKERQPTWIPTLNVPKSTQTRPGPRAYILVLVVALEDGFTLRVRDLRVHHLDIVRRCARGGILRGHDELMGCRCPVELVQQSERMRNGTCVCGIWLNDDQRPLDRASYQLLTYFIL